VIKKDKNMKFAAALISMAAAAANDASVVDANCKSKAGNTVCWESYFTLAFNNDTQKLEVDPASKTGSCGLQYDLAGESLINSTCTVTANGANLAFGNGAFVNGPASVTGFDGVSGSVSVIATWDTAFDEAWVAANSNATTGELIITNTTEFNHEDCFTTGLNKFIEVSCTDNGAPHLGPWLMFTNNSPNAENNFAIVNYGEEGTALSVTLGVGCDVDSVSSPMGIITPGSDSDCSFSIEVTDDAPQLLYFQATTTEVVDFFAATVA